MKIPFTNVEIFKKNNPNSIEVDRNVFEALASTDSKFNDSRPGVDPQRLQGDDEVHIPTVPLPFRDLYRMAEFSDTLGNIHNALKTEIFRKGYEIREKFSRKCESCEKEFDQPVDECDDCGSEDLRDPDINQKEAAKLFLDSCNDNEQSLIDVSESMNDDLETVDDGYMLFTKEYFFDGEGNLLYEMPVELLKIDPIVIHIIADRAGRPGRKTDGDLAYVCVVHRDRIHNQIKRCPGCQREMVQAYYRALDEEGKFIYYSKDEVHHRSKYKPSLTYGFSPIYSLWMKIVTLMNMDNYIKNYYAKQRPPRGLLFVNTPNMGSVEKAWSWMLDEFKKNPHTIPPIAIEAPAGSRGNFVNFIDFMKTPDEMQMTEMRDENRRQIGARYGVMPIFQADISTSGGLNNEGLQVTVTNRASKKGQKVFNQGYYVWIAEQLGLTDYEIILPESEEQDKVANEDLTGKKMENAKRMQDMGFDVTYNEDGDFEFEPLEEPVEKPDVFGGLGAPGGVPQQPSQGQSFEGQPAEAKNAINKEDAPVTSDTPGVFNPSFGGNHPVRRRRRKLLRKMIPVIVKQALNQSKEITKADVILDDIDKVDELIDKLEGTVFSQKFEGMNSDRSEKIKNFIIRSIVKGTPEKNILEFIQRKGATSKAAQTIANTETQALSNAVRDFAFEQTDPEDKKDYDWTGPNDDSTTPICKFIKKRADGGVSREKLKQIVKEESENAIKRGELPANFNAREYTPHFNCRHVVNRHFD